MRRSFLILFCVLFFSVPVNAFIGEGYINVNKATIRKRATTKSKAVDFLVADKKITLVKKRGQWYNIKYKKKDKAKSGWISGSLIRLIETSEIDIEFININEKYKKIFRDNLLFLDNQLREYDLTKLKLLISYSDATNVARMMLVYPFNKNYYNDKKTKEMSGSFIDFMVYNDYLWGLVKYKKHVAESVQRESMDDFQAVMAFNANLLLKKSTGDSVILSGKFSGDYVVFNPYIDVDFNSYKPFRVFTPDAESVVESSVFYLPKPKSSEGRLRSATLLYNFFDLDY